MPLTLGAQSVGGIPSFQTQPAVQCALYACRIRQCQLEHLEA